MMLPQNMLSKPDTTPADYKWPDEFWSDFIDNYWEQEPTCFKWPTAKPFIDLDEVFTATVKKSKYTGSDRLWIAKNLPPKVFPDDFIMGAVKLLGPQKKDGDFDGYFKRLSQHKAGINLHNLDEHLPDLWERMQSFVKHFSKVEGKPPATMWDIDTFFGTYPATPFGIHKDPASVFAFGLMGERTYCTWKSDYFKTDDDAVLTPDLDKIEPHLKNGKIFTVKQGEVCYWPSDCWHVVLSDCEPFVFALISAYFNEKDLEHWGDYSTERTNVVKRRKQARLAQSKSK